MDTTWYRDINHFATQTAWAHGFMKIYAHWLGLAILALLLIAAWWFGRYTRHWQARSATTLACGVGTIIALLVNQHAISPHVARVRPCHALSHVHTLLTCANDYSFASDHCTIAGALIVGIVVISRKLGIAAILLALLLAFSRVYMGVHYPGDVAGGLALGAVVDVLALVVFRRALRVCARRVGNTRARWLVRA